MVTPSARSLAAAAELERNTAPSATFTGFHIARTAGPPANSLFTIDLDPVSGVIFCITMAVPG